MNLRISRRRAMQAAGALALAPPLEMAAPAAKQWPLVEGPDTPKLCLGMGDGSGPLPPDQGGRLAGEAARPPIRPA
jgi:hypothetical protein